MLPSIFLLMFSFASEENFRAIVQYERGKTFVDKQPAKFKTLVNNGQRIQAEKKSYIKFISKNRCYGVLYEDASATAIKKDQWQVEGDFRWLCPQGAKENLMWRGKNVLVSDSEIYVEGDNIISIKGLTTVGKTKLKTGVLYKLEANKLVASAQNMQEGPTYDWFAEKRLPRESYFNKLPEPDRDISRRIAITPMVGAPYIELDKNDMQGFRDNFRMHGIRASYNFLKNNRSYLLTASYYTLKHKNQDKDMPIADDLNKSQYNIFDLQFGERLNHNASTSLYWLAGLSFSTLEIDYYFPGTLYHNGKSRYIGASAGAGISHILWPSAKMAIQTNLEFYLARTIKRTRHSVIESSAASNNFDRNPHITTWAIMLYLGPVYQF
tara:strand:- start:16436 stop:17578 length:1143 start_codon:yes stop_codon:yes gene_type:complete